MSVTVDIPVRLRVDPRALTERLDDIDAALTDAVGRALSNSAEVVLEPRGMYQSVRWHAPRLTWTGDGLDAVAAATREEVEARVAAAVAAACVASPLSAHTEEVDGDSTPLMDEPVEVMDPRRLFRLLGLYRTPAYDNEGEAVAIDFAGTLITPESETELSFVPRWTPMSVSQLQRNALTILEQAESRWGAVDGDIVYLMAEDVRGGYTIFAVHRENGFLYGLYFRGLPDRLEIINPTHEQPVTAVPSRLTAGRGLMWHVTLDEMLEILKAEVARLILTHARARGAVAETMTASELEQAVDAVATDVAESRIGNDPAVHSYLVVSMGGGPQARFPAAQRDYFEGTLEVLPVADLVSPLGLPGAPGVGDGEANGEGDEDRAYGGGGDGGGEGRGQRGRRRGGFVYSGRRSGEETSGRFFPASQYAAGAEFDCSSLLGEPSLDQLGADGQVLRRLMDEIAFRLQISPCGHVARFVLNAARAIGSRAAGVGAYATDDQGATRPVESGNLGLLQFVPTASPAVQFLRHLAGTVPLLTQLLNLVERIYSRPEHFRLIGPPWNDHPVQWGLHYRIEIVDDYRSSVAYLFGYTCQVLMLQLLRTSRQGIDDRIANFETYGPILERMILSQISNIADLESLRDRLSSELPREGSTLEAVGRGAFNTWRDARQGVIDVFSAENPFAGGVADEGEMIRRNGQVIGIRDQHGNPWTLADLDAALSVRRGTAESIDPFVRQLIHDDELVERLRRRPSAIRAEMMALLLEMRENNREITGNVRSSADYAFRASAIQESLQHRTVPGTSYALGGIHLQAHEQIGEFFRADPFYAEGINRIFGVEQGRQGLIQFFEFTGVMALSILCPPLGAVVGGGLALYHYSEAVEREQVFESLLDPELVLSRAEVEAELFAAELGVVLSFIPQGGSILRGGTAGVRSVARHGVRGGARVFGRYARRAVTRSMAQQLKNGFLVAAVREIATDQIVEAALNNLLLEPIMREIQREFGGGAMPPSTTAGVRRRGD